MRVRVMLSVLLGAWAALLCQDSPAAAQLLPNCHVEPLSAPVAEFPGISFRSFHVGCSNNPGPEHQTLAHVLTIAVTSTLVLQASSIDPGPDFTQALPSAVLTTGGAQVAVNANLFTECCHYGPNVSPTLLRGWEVAQGKTLSAPGANLVGGPPAPFNASLVESQDGVVSIVYSGQKDPLPLNVMTAVTGSHMLVFGHKNVAPQEGQPQEFFGPNARTQAGLSADGKTLWLVALDRSPNGGQPNTGLTLFESAEFLLKLGAASAINLDGGGSSTMVKAAPGGTFAFLNAPSDMSQDGMCTVYYPDSANAVSCERFVGATLAVHVLPQASPTAP